MVAAVLAVTEGGCESWYCSIEIYTGTLPDGVVGEYYETPLTAEGECFTGRAPGPVSADWRIVGGNLPPGLRLIVGRIEGTPTTAGLFVFEVEAQQWGNADRKEMSIRIHPEP